MEEGSKGMITFQVTVPPLKMPKTFAKSQSKFLDGLEQVIEPVRQ